MIKFFNFLLISIVCISCSPPNLITPRYDLNSNLRLNGYYVFKCTDPLSGTAFSNSKFIFKNGVTFKPSGQNTHSDIVFQKRLKDDFSKYMDNYRKLRSYWQVTSISNLNITIEGWYDTGG